MNFPVTYNQALNQATEAYQNFERRSIPFAAVKLNIAMQNWNEQQCDQIVEDNFRSKKDVIYKKSDAYVILMHDTTLEAAESATQRLKSRLGQLNPRGSRFENMNAIEASAYILGPGKGTRALLIRYLDLSSQLNHRPQFDILQPSFREYLKWLNTPESNTDDFEPRISITI